MEKHRLLSKKMSASLEYDSFRSNIPCRKIVLEDSEKVSCPRTITHKKARISAFLLYFLGLDCL